MRKRRSIRLWAVFASVIFAVLCITALLIFAVAYLLYRNGILAEHKESPMIPIFFLILLSALIAMVLFCLVAQFILRPIRRFTEATKEVAKGNFNVTMEEASRVDEVRELTHYFNQMTQELAGTETLRTDFVVNVSHEFKTPLAAIEGYATLLQDNELSKEEWEEYTHMIIDSSRELSTLAENILNLSRLENQEVLLDKKMFRLDEQIREVIVLLEPKWGKKEIELEIDLAKARFYSNKSLLRQVWLNLIDNAIKFTPESGHIRIQLSRRHGCFIVEIQDDGKGIAPADQTHIFEKFYQVSKARKDHGNGLGLALVKRIVELCQGTVKVQSEPGKGSTFTVSLPAEEPAPLPEQW